MTAFLSLDEQSQTERICQGLSVSFVGGRKEPMRSVAVIQDLCSEILPAEDLAPVCILYSPLDARYDPLAHKDVLGALMHLGIEREVIGDIAVEKDGLYVACLDHMADYIARNCSRIRRQSIDFHPLEKLQMPEARYEDVEINIPSMRLDAIAAVLGHCSRAEAMRRIRQGMVQKNGMVLSDNCQIQAGDLISVRGHGKYQVSGIKNETRKGRLVLQLRKFA